MNMAGDSRYKCPTCGSSLTRERYERVLRIDGARRTELAHAKEELTARRRALDEEYKAKLARAESAARADARRLREELEHAKAAAARKGKITSQERREIAQTAADRAEARLGSQLRRLQEERDRSEQRRQREAESMKRQLAQLQQRAEARDRMHFGPEGEEELEAVLRRQFHGDDIQRRGRGGDILHTVIERGTACGLIVYECKRTADWKLDYVRQLKRAMESHATRWGLLVSRTLPPRQSGFCLVDGVVVIAPQLAQYFVRFLRGVIIELNRARLSEEGKASKVEEVYRYLRSDEFKGAMQGLAERTKELRTSLEREKSSHENWWTMREQSYNAIARHSSTVENRVHEILAPRIGRSLATVRTLRP
jgi:hypothetical protein